MCLCTHTCEIYIWITCVKSLSFCSTCPDKYRLHTTKWRTAVCTVVTVWGTTALKTDSNVTWPFGPPVCHIVIATYMYCWLLWHQPSFVTKHQEFCECIVLYTWLYMRYFNHCIFPYTESSSSQQEGGLHEATPEVLHLILTNLLYGPKDQFGNTSYCLCECGHSSFMFKYILNLL